MSKITIAFLATIALLLSFQSTRAGSATRNLNPTANTLADSPLTFEVLLTFDYPGATGVTQANAINDNNEVAGWFISDNGQHGFVRFGDKFSGPISDPNDRWESTVVTGVNNAATLYGSYVGADSAYHVFLLAGSKFTDIDIGSSNLLSGGISDANNICGSTLNPYEAFVVIDGVAVIFGIPGAGVTQGTAINNLNECIGYYSDSSGTYGFHRSADGTLHYPISTSPTVDTYLYGINDRGLMVGATDDATGEHAILFAPGNKQAMYDYPGAGLTRFTGINNRGFIAGFYEDGSGSHSFIVRVRSSAGE